MTINYELYLDSRGRPDFASGGVNMVAINTPVGNFNVWTKRNGNNPACALVFLHGGPGGTHDAFINADSYLPLGGIEYHYYDQLGAGHSDAPQDPRLWTIDRFVEELEQVRIGLGLDASNFFILGHSWGGVLAIEYALKYQQNLKGMVISNMMSSIPAYNAYANDVLMPQIDPAVLDEIKAFEANGETDNPRYEELLIEHHYIYHVLRRPFAEWPYSVLDMFGKLNKDIYVPMQGPSELGASGLLAEWDRTADLATINVPTLVIGATHDTMDPAFLEHMSNVLPHGEFLLCPDGSHCAFYDDADVYFAGLIDFLQRHS